MGDLISRQAAIDAVKKNTFRLIFAEEQNYEGHVAWSANAVYGDVIEGTLLELPSAQPEHPKGKWIPVTRIYKATKDEFPYMHIEWVDSTELDEIDGLRCSKCGTVYDFTEARNWCSECGADMRGEQDANANA